jgi:ferritin-like metal-binding protein YciE
MEDTMARKKDKDLNDLFLDTLKDIYYAENKILKALPKMAKAAQAQDLQSAFRKHLAETQGQVKRLERIFADLDQAPKGKKCPAIDGIIKEGDEIAKDYKGSAALDAGLLAAAQAVEHYEISRYGTLKCWATELGMDNAVRLIDETLAQEKMADANLSKLAEGSVNDHAKMAA